MKILVQKWIVSHPDSIDYEGSWGLPQPRSVVGLSVPKAIAFYLDEEGKYRELRWEHTFTGITWYVSSIVRRPATLTRYAFEWDDWISLLHITNVDAESMLRIVYEHVKPSFMNISTPSYMICVKVFPEWKWQMRSKSN